MNPRRTLEAGAAGHSCVYSAADLMPRSTPLLDSARAPQSLE
jgi:hypothetical protein